MATSVSIYTLPIILCLAVYTQELLLLSLSLCTPFSLLLEASRRSLRVLATESIVDAVNRFSKEERKLSPRSRIALVEELERIEENAECYPVRVNVNLNEVVVSATTNKRTL